MVLEYKYSVHGFSGGMMLARSVDGKVLLDDVAVGSRIDCPNVEIVVTLLCKCTDAVTLKVSYRDRERILTISRNTEERFCEEANAYGFTLAFKLCDRSEPAIV